MNLRNGKYDKKYFKLVQEIKNLCNELRINLCAKSKLTTEECLVNLFNFIKKEERLPSSAEEMNFYYTLMNLRNGKYDKEYSKLVQEIKDLCNELNLPLRSRKTK